jgi:hypothetical protein
VSALLIGDYSDDRLVVPISFLEARNRWRAMQCLERNPVEVVIADAGISN